MKWAVRLLRVREEINLHFQESRRTHGKTRGERIASYLTDEQRSQAGWIGASKCEVIFERALSICLVLIIIGCATGISRQVRSQVTYNGPFAELQKAPDEHLGEIVILGGKIIETKGSETSSEITVLQLPLDRKDRPQEGDRSEGRYLVRSEQFLDPAIYQEGSLLTVVGRLSTSEVRSIGGFQYVYPLVEAIEIKLWPRTRQATPSIHFGVGVGTWF